jgi:large conductance mechanosensitive channel
VIIGTALGAVVNSLVKDIIMPPIGMVLGNVDFSQLKIVLKAATGGDPTTEVAIRYGAFLNLVITFVIVAFVVYAITKVMLRPAPPAPVKNCPFCRESVPADATKCRACTSAI